MNRIANIMRDILLRTSKRSLSSIDHRYKSHAIFPSRSLSSRVYDNNRNCTCAMTDLGKNRKKYTYPEYVINDRYFLIAINNALHPRPTLLNLLHCDISLFSSIGLPEQIYNNIIDISKLYVYVYFFSLTSEMTFFPKFVGRIYDSN